MHKDELSTVEEAIVRTFRAKWNNLIVKPHHWQFTVDYSDQCINSLFTEKDRVHVHTDEEPMTVEAR